MAKLIQWHTKGFAPQISDIPSLSLQHTQWPKINRINCYEILFKKTDYRWHGNDKACI